MQEELKCINCGRGFNPTCHISRQKFCSDECRIKYNNIKRYFNGEVDRCPQCGLVIEPSGQVGRRKRFCNNICAREYRKRAYEFLTCEWCGIKFDALASEERKYCSRECVYAAQWRIAPFRRGSRRISFKDVMDWKERLTQATELANITMHERRVWLVCGETSMHTSMDGLVGIIRHELRHNPYDGAIYAFCGYHGSMVKYLFWDGSSFFFGKRRTQSGSYPWPPKEAGELLEITEKQFEFIKEKSIVPFRERKEYN